MIVQRFNLNLIPNQSPVVVHVNQYDTGTGRLIATLYEGNEPYSPSGTAVIQGTKPDGHGFQYSATLDGNVVTADLTEQMSPVAGDVRAQIVVTETSGVTGTFVFIMRVQPSALPSDTDMSESDYPLIEEAIREAQEAVIDSHDNAENSEAWAQGTRGGIPVGPTDPTYEHNAEYWAHQAEGAASGVSSFNGRSGSVLPIAGDYDSEKILLASALHIGGETQSNVQEALEALVNDGGAGHTILNGLGQEMPQRKNLRFAGANLSDDAQNDTTNVTITGGSGGSTITVTTIETTLYGETVTITDGTSTFTGVFDNSGVCVIDGVTVTGTLTVSSGAASRTLNVPYFGNYTVALSFWVATINVSTDPDVVSAIVKKDGVQIGTVNFTSGSGTYIAGSTGAYTFEVTVGGIVFSSPTVNVTQQTTYSTTIDIFSAILNISTSASSLYGKTITIKKGSTTVGTTAFSAQGSASYTVHETGTYTCECEGYSGSATVSAETTYNVTINTVETFTVTVDIYSAASDTLSYTDDNGAQTVTTDATGKATGVSITITEQTPGHAEITFTSSVAKDPTNLSNDYSKSVTLTSGTTEIYVMPDNALYWYGCNDNAPLGGMMRGFENQGAHWTFNTNNVSISSAWQASIINKVAINYSEYAHYNVYCDVNATGALGLTMGSVAQSASTSNQEFYNRKNQYSSVSNTVLTQSITTTSDYGFACYNNTDGDHTIGATVKAIWFD